MEFSSLDKLFIEINKEKKELISTDEVFELLKSVENLETCRIWLGKDGGPRPWWHRLLGTRKRFVDSLFALEWHNQIAILIFHNENWSEYRAIDQEHPVSVSENDRLEIAQGEKIAPSNEECISKQRALAAVYEYLQSGKRPNWLNYNFVE
ncbi:hypothetical protein BFX25_13945 [Vibrio cholerae]|uniref:hypothetical protein n=1 Tax=Vibrio cholerae TaxID=666 RepID=UPI0008934FD9|nr:hypothetical protein [Vibrio cholerae]OFJ05931.1 hypothetical protein BFX25_13945 [Vibrio cholerae]